MTRRVGFGEAPKGGGGFPWTMLLVLAVLLFVAVAVFDPGLVERAQRWAWGQDGSEGAAPWLIGFGVLLAVFLLGRTVLRAFLGKGGKGRDRWNRPAGAPPIARGRSAPPPAPRRGPAPAPAERPEKTSAQPAPLAGSKAGGCFAIVFLMFWLCGWTVGIIFAISAFMGGFGEGAAGPHWFLLIWIAFAVLGWFAAAGVLFNLIRELFARR